MTLTETLAPAKSPYGLADTTFARMDRAELERRWAAVRSHMRAHDLDVLIVQAFDDPSGGCARWLCDFGSQSNMKVVLFFVDTPMVTIEHGALSARRAVDPWSPDTPGVETVISTAAFASVAGTLLYEAQLAAEELKRRGCRRIGLVRSAGMTHGFVSHLKESLPQADFGDETDVLDRLKAAKSPEEFAHIREACRIQDKVFETLLESVRPGMRDVDLVALAEHEFRLHGAHQGTMAAGSAPWGKPAMLRPWRRLNRVLEKGDYFTILLELSGPSGYCGEVARQIVLGPATPQHRETFAIVKEAQEATVARFVPGARCREIADAHDAFLKRAGFGPELRLYAHGQGYDMVERPLIRKDEEMVLDAGMFMACHPAIATPEMFVFLCDNFIVSEQGKAERVHATPQQLFEV